MADQDYTHSVIPELEPHVGGTEPPLLDGLLATWRREQIAHANAAVFADDLQFSVAAKCRSSKIQYYDGDTVRVKNTEPSSIDISRELKIVGGLDISFSSGFSPDHDGSGPDEQHGIAVLALLSFPELQLVKVLSKLISFAGLPYVSSYLGAREAGIFASLVEQVKGTEYEPGCIFVDGNGRLHPRQAGSAVSVGVKTSLPCIGVAKNYHPVRHEHKDPTYLDGQKSVRKACRALLRRRGDWLPLFDDERLGAALLSAPAHGACRPVYVSAGHRISLETAVCLTLAVSSVARVCEPIRQADLYGRKEARSIRPKSCT